MIHERVFRVSRQAARLKLDPALARESFGYHIDVNAGWESHRMMEDLLYIIGIHQTHEPEYPHIINDLGTLTPAEYDWAKRFLRFYDRVQGLLTTNRHRVRLHFDIAETIVDWRYILKFVELPARILDFGAGGGRQCVSSFLRHPENIYTAVDTTLAGYTIQNLVFSLMDVLGAQARFIDFLDVETAGYANAEGGPQLGPPPSIADAPPGSRFHVPAWFEGKPLPSRFFDLIIACHVHNELSTPDFMRLMNIVDRCLADEGVFYVRSELSVEVPGVRSRLNYMDVLDFHGMDPVAVLATKNIAPIYSVYTSAFQTTVFARIGSKRYNEAQDSTHRDRQFTDVRTNWEASLRAGTNYTLGVLEWLGESERRIAFCGSGGDTYERLVAPHVEQVHSHIVFSEDESMSGGDQFSRALAEFNPDVVVCCSENWNLYPIETNVRTALGGEFKIRLQQNTPIAFLLRDWQRPLDPILTTDIRVPGQIEKILGEPPPSSTGPGFGLFDRWPER